MGSSSGRFEQEPPVWLATGAEPRPRDRAAEARRLFVPGGCLLLASAALGVVLMVAPGTSAPVAEVAVRSAVVTPPAPGRGMYALRPSPPPAPAPVSTAALALEADAMPVLVLHGEDAVAGGAAVVATLRKGGWPVSRATVGDLKVRQTTVFYPKGKRAAGREVALALPGIQRMRVSSEPLRADAVTVVLAPPRSA